MKYLYKGHTISRGKKKVFMQNFGSNKIKCPRFDESPCCSQHSNCDNIIQLLQKCWTFSCDFQIFQLCTLSWTSIRFFILREFQCPQRLKTLCVTGWGGNVLCRCPRIKWDCSKHNSERKCNFCVTVDAKLFVRTNRNWWKNQCM